jgi:hypothetical protein
MDSRILGGKRGLTFVRGLYHVAACDGFHPREREALQIFIDTLELAITIDAIAAQPFDYSETAQGLESTWLRRVFIQACKIMVQMDGKVTAQERDAMRALASAMGIDEDLVLDDLEGPQPPPNELVEWVEALQVDFVSWDDYNQPGYFWFFPHPSQPLAHGASLHIYEGQSLVIRYDGEITDILEPGRYTVSPRTLPGLAAAANWAGGSVSAECLFIRTAASSAVRWGLANGIELQRPSGETFILRAYGRCAIRFGEVALVISRLAQHALPDDADVERRLGRIVAGRFGQALQTINAAPDTDILASLEDMDMLRDTVAPMLREAVRISGLRLTRFDIENITVPLELGIRPRSARSRELTRVGSQVLGKNTGHSLPSGNEYSMDERAPKTPDGFAKTNASIISRHRRSADSLPSVDETSWDFAPTDDLD